MSKVITLSRTFPKGHPKAGEPTYFVEQVLNAMGIDYRKTEYYDNLILWNAEKIYEGKLDSSQILSFSSDLSFNSVMGEDIISQKLHTIRAKSINKNTGEVYSRWKQGDKASLRVWSGTPYKSPQIIIAPEVELVQVGKFRIVHDYFDTPWIDIGSAYSYPDPIDFDRSIIPTVAKNDGLSTEDLLAWFNWPRQFEGQILCWKEVDYV